MRRVSLFNFLTESNSQDDIRDCLDDRAASLNTQTGPKAAEPSETFRAQHLSQTFRAQQSSQTLRAQHQSIILSGVS